MRSAGVSVTNTSPFGVSWSHRGLVKFSAKTFTIKPVGTSSRGFAGTPTTWAGFVALDVLYGGGRSANVKCITVLHGSNHLVGIMDPSGGSLAEFA